MAHAIHLAGKLAINEDYHRVSFMINKITRWHFLSTTIYRMFVTSSFVKEFFLSNVSVRNSVRNRNLCNLQTGTSLDIFTRTLSYNNYAIHLLFAYHLDYWSLLLSNWTTKRRVCWCCATTSTTQVRSLWVSVSRRVWQLCTRKQPYM